MRMREFVSHIFLHEWRFRLTPDLISKLQCKLEALGYQHRVCAQQSWVFLEYNLQARNGFISYSNSSKECKVAMGTHPIVAHVFFVVISSASLVLRFCEQRVESLHHGSCDLENFSKDLCTFLHAIFAYLPVVKILGLAVLSKVWMENLTDRESGFRLKRWQIILPMPNLVPYASFYFEEVMCELRWYILHSSRVP